MSQEKSMVLSGRPVHAQQLAGQRASFADGLVNSASERLHVMIFRADADAFMPSVRGAMQSNEVKPVESQNGAPFIRRELEHFIVWNSLVCAP
jgi:hypothetical protein